MFQNDKFAKTSNRGQKSSAVPKFSHFPKFQVNARTMSNYTLGELTGAPRTIITNLGTFEWILAFCLFQRVRNARVATPRHTSGEFVIAHLQGSAFPAYQSNSWQSALHL